MFILYSLTFTILFFIVISFSIVTVLNRNTYSDLIDALDSKKNKLKIFFPFGFYILDKFNYSFASTYDRKLLNYICEIYGQEYSAFYLRALYSKKIVLTAFIIEELAAALVFQFDGTILAYILLITVLFWFSDDRRLKSKVMNRRLEIQLEFPNFINKLTLLLNAGMTMSKAWEKISDDRVGVTDEVKSAFYKEVLKTVTELRTGKNEAEAYSQFAKRVKTPEISRLMSTILQNTKKGGNDLVLSLRLQSSECWEMRKNAIRRLGEEASTKLLLPMMIMFFAIIIIVVTPAIISMQEQQQIFKGGNYMLSVLKRFITEEDGMGTVEVIIIIAVLVGVALLFRKQLIDFVNGIIDNLFPDASKLEDNKAGTQGKLGQT